MWHCPRCDILPRVSPSPTYPSLCGSFFLGYADAWNLSWNLLLVVYEINSAIWFMGSQVVSSVKWAWKQQEQKSSSLTTQSNVDGIWRVLNYSCRQLRPSQLWSTGWPALKPNKCKYPTEQEGERGRCIDWQHAIHLPLLLLLFLFPLYVCVCVCGWANKSLGWSGLHVSQSVIQSVKSQKAQRNWNQCMASCTWPIPRPLFLPPIPLSLHLPLCTIGSCHCSLLMFMAHFAILRLSFTKLVRLQLWEEHRGSGRMGGGWFRGNWQSVLQAMKNEAYAQQQQQQQW